MLDGRVEPGLLTRTLFSPELGGAPNWARRAPAAFSQVKWARVDSAKRSENGVELRSLERAGNNDLLITNRAKSPNQDYAQLLKSAQTRIFIGSRAMSAYSPLLT